MWFKQIFTICIFRLIEPKEINQENEKKNSFI